MIPKKHLVRKWHLILDLSSPERANVNDWASGKTYAQSSTRILTKQPSLSWRQGSGPCFQGIDIKDASHIVPVYPEDWTLLGMQWHGQYIKDTCLPLGLR